MKQPVKRPIPANRRALSFASMIALGIFLSGCSLFGSEAPQRYSEAAGDGSLDSPEGVDVSLERLDPAAHKSAGRFGRQESRFIEVLWEVPSPPVQGYILRYGTSEGALSESVTLLSEQLQRVRTPDNNELYRYLLPEPTRDKTVYITIAAVHDLIESAPTKALAVPPDEEPNTTQSQLGHSVP